MKDKEEQSFVIGGHLIDPNLHQSITDPEIQTIKKKRKQEKLEAKRLKKKKRKKDREDK